MTGHSSVYVLFLCTDLRIGNIPLTWCAGRATSREDETFLLDCLLLFV